MNEDVHTLAVSPNDPDRVFALTGGGLFRTQDGGNHWRLVEGPFPTRGMVVSIVADPEQSTRLFAGTTDGALLASDDGGASWLAAADGLPRIEEMVITPRSPR